jgi:hypothetical protein
MPSSVLTWPFVEGVEVTALPVYVNLRALVLVLHEVVEAVNGVPEDHDLVTYARLVRECHLVQVDRRRDAGRVGEDAKDGQVGVRGVFFAGMGVQGGRGAKLEPFDRVRVVRHPAVPGLLADGVLRRHDPEGAFASGEETSPLRCEGRLVVIGREAQGQDGIGDGAQRRERAQRIARKTTRSGASRPPPNAAPRGKELACIGWDTKIPISAVRCVRRA